MKKIENIKFRPDWFYVEYKDGTDAILPKEPNEDLERQIFDMSPHDYIDSKARIGVNRIEVHSKIEKRHSFMINYCHQIYPKYPITDEVYSFFYNRKAYIKGLSIKLGHDVMVKPRRKKK